MVKKYIDDINLQIAMTEYNEDLTYGDRVDDQYDRTIGRLTQVYDNEHGDGEQVYVAFYKE